MKIAQKLQNIRSVHSFMVSKARVAGTALLVTSLLLGLIPPPLIEGVVTNSAAHTVDLTSFVEAWLQPAAVQAAPLDMPKKVDLREPTRLNFSAKMSGTSGADELESATVKELQAVIATESAPSSCPAGSSLASFSWADANNSSGAVWNFNDQSNTYTIDYMDTQGNPDSIDVTVTMRDPDERNIDANAFDAGIHPYDPAGACRRTTDLDAPDDWPGSGSLDDPWDSDCRGAASDAATGTNMSYGANYMTWFIHTENSAETVFFDVTFSKDAYMDNFTIGDIDSVGLAWTYSNFHSKESPGSSYQDVVSIAASKDGTNVPVTLSGGSATTITGQTAKATYNINQRNNVSPDDPAGTVSASTMQPFDAITLGYSNGPDDAAAEQNNPRWYSWWSNANGATNGVSDSQGIRFNGFTFCAADQEPPDPLEIGNYVWLDADGNGIQDPNESGIANVDVTLTKSVATNLALSGTATSSGSGFGSAASDANDDNTDSRMRNGSVWHANNSTQQPWLQIDLGNQKSIKHIELWNRTDCCSERLSNAWVFVDDQDFTASNSLGTLADAMTNADFAFHIGNMDVLPQIGVAVDGKGRYVRIWSDGSTPNSGYMALAEVQVVGWDALSTITTTTNSNGEYYFNDTNVHGGLKPSTQYQLKIDLLQSALAGKAPTQQNINSGISNADAVDSDGGRINNFAVIDLTTAAAGYSNHTYDFGFVTVDKVISGRAWQDQNRDGIQDSGELGVGDVEVKLYNSANTQIAQTTTGNDGSYIFSSIAAGEYIIAFAQPDESIWFTNKDQGNDDSIDSDANPASGVTDIIDSSSSSASHVDVGFVGSCTGNDLGGTIYRDFNSNGLQDINEPGFTDVTVMAYDDAGTGYTGIVNSDGTYRFTNLFADGASFRIEFSGLPSWAQSSVKGSDNGTTVQIHKIANCTADLAVQNPADYCQSNPNLATSCFVNGDPLNSGAELDAFVMWPHSSVTTGSEMGADTIHLGSAQQIGTTWGVAYKGDTAEVYTTSFLRRHAGLGPLGIGGIYVIDLSNPAAANDTTEPYNWLDLQGLDKPDGGVVDVGAVPARPDLGAATAPSADGDVYPLIGKIGLGGIDISEDYTTLYVMNLNHSGSNAGELLAIDIASQAISAVYPIPQTLTRDSEDNSTASSGGADLRPWAVKVKDGEIYVGVVDSAETNNAAADLHAWVLRLNGTTFEQVFDFALDYPRGSWLHHSGNGTWHYNWNVWSNENDPFPPIPSFSNHLNAPQPFLADIEFDTNGDLILGLADRFGYQTGTLQYGPDGTGSYVGNAQGDILRVCSTPTNGWMLERNGTCGGITTAGANKLDGFGNPVGPSGGEWFYQDALAGLNTGHFEVGNGGLALLPTSGEVAFAVTNPTSTYAGGTQYYSTSSGKRNRGYNVYRSRDIESASKSAGIGDIELICALAPIELGNYVWLDSDADGIQDPTETGIPGVLVNLYAANGALAAVATTDTQGEYYFVDATDPRVSAGGIWDGAVPANVGVVSADNGNLLPNTAYQIRIDMTQTSVAAFELTLRDTDSGTGLSNLSDSDALVRGSYAFINLTTGNAGQNDHTFDFGFKQPGSISAHIWSDDENYGNGTFDERSDKKTAEANVTINLLDSSGNIIITTVTNVNGNYLFDNLPVNVAYTVQIDTTTLPGSELGFVVYDPDGGDDHKSTVMLTRDDPTTLQDEANNSEQDFIYFIPSAQLGSIGDQIWNDNDNDGNNRLDGDDTPLTNVTVYLLDSSGTIIATDLTGADGAYYFEDLALNSTYTVQVDTMTLPLSKRGNLAYDPDGGNDSKSTILLATDDPATLGSETQNLSQDFAYFISSGPLGSIGDTIFHDTNSDGVFNPANGDFSQPSVVVTLTDSNGNSATTMTNSNGRYLFDDLPLGEYTVLVDTSTLPTGMLTTPTADPDGGADSKAQVLLTSSEPNNLTQNFGYEQNPLLASVGNFFWVDTDQDGIMDLEESPLVDAKVTLYDADGNVIEQVMTDANGYFVFTVPENDYYLRFELPVGYSFIGQNAEGGYNSDVDASTGQTGLIHLRTGTYNNWGAGVALKSFDIETYLPFLIQ